MKIYQLNALLKDILKFNYHFTTKEGGMENSIKKELEALVKPEIKRILNDNNLTYNILVEESIWTYSDKNGNLHSIENFQTKDPSHHFYTACFQLFLHDEPLWLSQFSSDEIYNIKQICSYDIHKKPWENIAGQKIFISYSSKRQKLVDQLKNHLYSCGFKAITYKDPDVIKELKKQNVKDYKNLLHHIKQQMLDAEVIIYLEDCYAQSSIYCAIEKEFRWEEFNHKSIVVSIKDEHDQKRPDNNIFDVNICFCHWPEKFRELVVVIRSMIARNRLNKK